ncbi:MAG: ABC transporter permease [Actinomycetota bacterium]|nr:ABC transporter permease [Actinomycetota bacterium]
MSDFLQYTVFGVMLGAGFAIAATGLVVTYAASGVFNFAHGAVGMTAAFLYWELVVHDHVPVPLALVVVLLVVAPLFGALVERVLMRRLHGASAERPVLVTLGLLVILTGVATLVWSPTVTRVVNPLVAGTFRLVGVNIEYQYVITVGLAAVVAVALRLLFFSTRTGLALRAVVDDPDLLAMAGASPNRVSQLGWVLGFVLAALAGVLIAGTQSTGVNIAALTLLVVNGYAAAVVGRLRNIPVTFAAAVGIGLAESYVNSYAVPHLAQNLQTDVPLVLPMIFFFVALVTVPAARLRAVGRLTTVRAQRLVGARQAALSGIAFAVVVVLCAVALAGDQSNGTTVLDLAGQVMAFGIVGLSLVLVTGYAGQVSLCQFAFMGIGAFVMGKVAGGGSLLGLVAAAGVCGVLGALVALPTVRLRDLYLALATFAFADAVATGFFADVHVFGSGGLTVGRVVLPGLSFGGDRAELLLVAGCFLGCAWLVLALRRSLVGRRLVALNDSPAAFATVGLNVPATRVVVFAVGAAMAGLAGALYGTVEGVVGTSDFSVFAGVIFFLFVTTWSVRSVGGALLASITYVVLANVWDNGLGLFAGAGVILVGRAAAGILGAEPLQRFAPLASRSTGRSGPAGEALGADSRAAEGAFALGSEARAAG